VIDLDHVVESDAGKSIREIFDDGGESTFRDLESDALRSVSSRAPAVISLGGGAILRAENRQIIQATGTCFWLDADAETIARRIAGDDATASQRPALTRLGELEEIRQLLVQRRDLYRSASRYRIETAGKSAQEVAGEILQIVRG
jgi:shikimate kinase